MIHGIHRLTILIGLIGAAVVLCLLADQNASAQVIPRQIDALQSVKPIEWAPVSPVEQLRIDVIRATDRSGRLNARKLAKPFLPEIQGPSNVSTKVVGQGDPFLKDIQGKSNVSTQVVPPDTPFLPIGGPSNVSTGGTEARKQRVKRARPGFSRPFQVPPQ